MINNDTATFAHYHVEDEALRNAVRLIEDYEPFHAHPHESPRHGGTIIGWLRRLSKQGISSGEARIMLRGDLTGHLASLRARIFALGVESLGAPRIAVLLHLAQLMGAGRIVEWQALWSDLGEGQYDRAANHLLMSEWPSLMGDSFQERIRAVALQQILRTGQMPDKPRAVK